MKRHLPSTVAPVSGPVSDDARRDAVVHAAVAYVVALRDWTQGSGFAKKKRECLHRCQRELVAAVGMVAAPDSLSGVRSDATGGSGRR